MKRISLVVILMLAVAGSLVAGDEIAREKPRQIGEVIDLQRPVASPSFSGAPSALDREGEGRAGSEASLVWSHVLSFPEAEYVAPHFSRFDLPAGAYVVVTSRDGSRSWRYEGKGKQPEGLIDGFWAIHIYGEEAIVELYSGVSVPAGAVTIDRFARGFKPWEMRESMAICGSDDSQWAKCYAGTTEYEKGKAVARLLIGGTSACTGWLVGSEGHVMTNEHCISTSNEANNTNYEFMAEGGTCQTSCDSWGACPGTVVATSGSLVKVNAGYDYALIKLPVNPTSTYGYLQLRNSGGITGERIYIPQHPQAWGKKIAMKDGSKDATLAGTTSGCSSRSYSDLAYNADTQGGSSGSPVLAGNDHLVIGLHHCGSCPNRAVPIEYVINDLGTSLPANAVGGGSSCTDADGDGYCSVASGGNDCDDSSSSIYPGAVEVCGNGVDDDCDGQVDEGCSTGGSITLTANGYKVKGAQRVDLGWSGATSTSVDIFRDGSKLTTTANDGAHTDSINKKGGGSYTYTVCEAGTSTCSNTATVSF